MWHRLKRKRPLAKYVAIPPPPKASKENICNWCAINNMHNMSLTPYTYSLIGTDLYAVGTSGQCSPGAKQNKKSFLCENVVLFSCTLTCIYCTGLLPVPLPCFCCSKGAISHIYTLEVLETSYAQRQMLKYKYSGCLHNCFHLTF